MKGRVIRLRLLGRGERRSRAVGRERVENDGDGVRRIADGDPGGYGDAFHPPSSSHTAGLPRTSSIGIARLSLLLLLAIGQEGRFGALPRRGGQGRGGRRQCSGGNRTATPDQIGSRGQGLIACNYKGIEGLTMCLLFSAHES